MLAKYNFHGKIHNWTHQSQVEMWWSWVFTLGTAKYIFFSCHSYNSSLCNTENKAWVWDINSFNFLSLPVHSGFPKKGKLACKLTRRVFKVLQKSDIGMFLFSFFTWYCTKLLADVDDASLDTFCSSLTRPSVLVQKTQNTSEKESLCRWRVSLPVVRIWLTGVCFPYNNVTRCFTIIVEEIS